MENTPLLHHLGHMVKTYTIVTGKDLVSKETWFKSPAEPEASRLEAWKHFFSQRMIEDWNNKIPASLEQAKNVKWFKKCYRT